MKNLKCLLFDIYSSVQRFLYATKDDAAASDELKEAELIARATAQAAEEFAAKKHDIKEDILVSDEAALAAEEARQDLEDLLKNRGRK